MKYFNKLIVGFISISILLAGCDKIDSPYTTIVGPVNNTNDTVRKVLLEDFTGHTCVNCPSAHKVAADLQQIYKNQLVVVAIHASYYANPKPAPYDYDFRTAEGTFLLSYFGLLSVPAGLVNRIKQNSGSYILDKGGFASAISKQIDSLSENPDAYIYLKPTFNATDSTLSVETETTFLTNLPSGKYNLTVLVTESHIVKPQKNNDASVGLTPDIFDYEHMHALRGMLTTALGDEILDGTPVLNQPILVNFTQFKFGSDWVPENCHVVAFITYADGPNINQIIQAQEVEVK